MLSSNAYDPVTNPCVKEIGLVYKCFDEYNYDKSKCQRQMDNYNGCKKFWGKVRRDRRSRGITPELPLPEDRESVKKEYGQKRI